MTVQGGQDQQGLQGGQGRKVAATGALVAAAVVCAGLAVGNLAGSSSKNTRSDGTLEHGDQGMTRAEGVACSRIIVEGDVVSLRKVSTPGRAILTFRVQDWIKPANGDQRITVNIIDPRPVATRTWEPGTHMVLTVPHRDDISVGSYRSAEGIELQREITERALSKPDQPACPNRHQPTN